MDPTPPANATLEELAYFFGTDKSHDDHKYVDLYSMLFDPIRASVRNVTEIGVAAGQSLDMWHSYFPSAKLFGIDIIVKKPIRRRFANKPRVSLHLALSNDAKWVRKLNFAPQSMDIVIDDGDHFPRTNEQTLLQFWPFVRPGGYYIVEDVVTGARFRTGRYGCKAAAARANRRGEAADCGFAPGGWSELAHNISFVSPEARAILEGNVVFFADTLVGHRAFDQFRRVMGVTWMKDRVNHNSHLLVIRKRSRPLPAQPQLHFSKVAMPHYG